MKKETIIIIFIGILLTALLIGGFIILTQKTNKQQPTSENNIPTENRNIPSVEKNTLEEPQTEEIPYEETNLLLLEENDDINLEDVAE